MYGLRLCNDLKQTPTAGPPSALNVKHGRSLNRPHLFSVTNLVLYTTTQCYALLDIYIQSTCSLYCLSLPITHSPPLRYAKTSSNNSNGLDIDGGISRVAGCGERGERLCHAGPGLSAKKTIDGHHHGLRSRWQGHQRLLPKGQARSFLSWLR